MGTYFNPDNESFRQAVRSRIYVDKTGLLEELNQMIGSEEKCIALSHARRFGKSQAAGMIDAYYSFGSDSRELFSKFKIAKAADFEEHLNQYNVIHIDVSSFTDSYKEKLVENIWRVVYSELKEEYKDIMDSSNPIGAVLMQIYRRSGRQFVIIIDEWDCVVRNHADRPDLVHEYLQFMHSLFKSEESKRFLALAYITLNYDGLKEDVLKMLSGGRVPVNVNTFSNDLSIINSKDEALTALIHLGYLGYDANRKTAYIPNFEVGKAYTSVLIQPSDR